MDVTQDYKWIKARRRMVDEQLRARGIKNESVLCVMSEVSRHEFVPVE